MSSGKGDSDSVWLKFTDRNMSVMRGARAEHPSRQLAYDVILDVFGNRHFEWLDVGVVGMVDYEKQRSILDFKYTGIDVSLSVIEDGERYLAKEGDRLVLADIANPIERLPEEVTSRRYGLITLRHILNHIENIDIPLSNVLSLLEDDGVCVLTLHMPLIETASEIEEFWGYPTEQPGKVIRHRLNRDEFLAKTSRMFNIERFVRIKDIYKPQDVLVFRKPGGDSSPHGLIPAPEIRQTKSLAWRMIRRLTPTRLRRLVLRVTPR